MPNVTRHILCVEDNDDTCFILKYLLGRAPGREVTTACSVAEARKGMAAGRFDLYILDMRLGGARGGGAEFCREVLRADPRAKVVFYTGAAYDEDRAAGLAAGAIDYVIKPDIKGLAEAVGRHLPPAEEEEET